MREASGLINRGDDYIPQHQKRRRRGNHEEGNLPQTSIETLAQNVRHFRLRADRARHRRKFRRGYRHAEQAYRQRVKRLRIGQRGDRSGGQQAGQQRIHIGADLHHSPADKHREKVAHDRAHVLEMKRKRQVKPVQQPQHHGQLNRHHQRGADDRAPRENDGQRVLRVARPESPQSGDHRRVPDYRRGVRKKKSPVAVQNSQTPRGKYEQAGARKKNPHDAYGQFALVAAEAWRDRIDQVGRREDADQNEDRGAQRQQGRNGSGGAARLFILIARQKRRINRNERSGEHALSK